MAAGGVLAPPFLVALPHRLRAQGLCPVPAQQSLDLSTAQRSPKLLFVVWLEVQPAQNCQHWGPALPTAMRNMRSQGWQSRHTAPFTAQGSVCALGLNDPLSSAAIADAPLAVAAHHSLPISAFPRPSSTLAVLCTGISWPSTPALHVPSPAHPSAVPISHPTRAVHSSGAMFWHCPSAPRVGASLLHTSAPCCVLVAPFGIGVLFGTEPKLEEKRLNVCHCGLQSPQLQTRAASKAPKAAH